MNSVLVRVGCLQVIDIIRCWFGVLVRRVGSPLLRKGGGQS